MTAASVPAVNDASSVPDLSVVCPVYNESEVLHECRERLVAALEATGRSFEIVFTDNRSTDDSLAIMRSFAMADHRIRVVSLSRNFGKPGSLTAGIDHARGRAVVLTDADMQDPPEAIGEMVRLWEAGNEMVYGQRITRRGEPVAKRLFTKVFYRLIGRISDTELPHDTGDFRLMDRKVVDALMQLREESRYLPGMVPWLGFKQCAMPYERDGRNGGRSHFSPRALFRFAMDAITSFSERPLRLASSTGLVITICSFLLTAVIVVRRLLEPSRSIPGFTSVLAAVLFMGGVQLLSIGLLGEYVGRIYRQSKGRPLYIVDELIASSPPAAETAPAAAASPVSQPSAAEVVAVPGDGSAQALVEADPG